MFGFPFSEDDRKPKGAQINPKTRTKCWVVPAGRLRRGTRERPPAPAPRAPAARAASGTSVTAHRARPERRDLPTPRKQNSGGRAPGAPRGLPGASGAGPTEKGTASGSFSGSRPLIRGRPQGEVPPEKGSSLPPPPSSAARRPGRRGGKKTFKPGAAGGASLGQTPQRPRSAAATRPSEP